VFLGRTDNDTSCKNDINDIKATPDILCRELKLDPQAIADETNRDIPGIESLKILASSCVLRNITTLSWKNKWFQRRNHRKYRRRKANLLAKKI